MGDAARGEDRLARPEPGLLLAEGDDVLPLDDVEELSSRLWTSRGVSDIGGTSSSAVIAPPESSALTRITVSIPPKTSRSSRTLRTVVCIGAGAAMNFKTAVRIERPIEEVFDYVSDPVNFPHWNSAVQSVRGTSPGEAAGATYLMERDLPGGRAENELAIVVWNRPAEFTIRTTSGPTPFTYQYGFSDEGGATLIELKAEVELAGIAGALGPLASPAVKRGVDANFAELKRILEGAGTT